MGRFDPINSSTNEISTALVPMNNLSSQEWSSYLISFKYSIVNTEKTYTTVKLQERHKGANFYSSSTTLKHTLSHFPPKFQTVVKKGVAHHQVKLLYSYTFLYIHKYYSFIYNSLMFIYKLIDMISIRTNQ